jgi:hypothetical protein
MKGFRVPAKKHKYHAKKIVVDGITFDSKKEANYYSNLKSLHGSGDIRLFLMQVPFRIPGGKTYRLDFLEFWESGEVRFVDVKGYDTPVSKLKRDQVEEIYNITIEIV